MSHGYKQGPCPKCPSSDGFTEWVNGSKHCFVCGYHSGGEWSGQQQYERLRQYQRDTYSREKDKEWVALPKDFEYSIPIYALKWLQKYDITGKEINENKIGWSEENKYLIFPVFDQYKSLLMWQGRYFGTKEKHPKWVTYGTRDDVMHFPRDWKEHDCVVLVEDIVSAIKVSRVTNCMPMFGSTLSQTMGMRVAHLFKKARVWADKDAQPKALKLSFRLTECGCPSMVIFTDKDPKEYQTADIRRIVDVLGE